MAPKQSNFDLNRILLLKACDFFCLFVLSCRSVEKNPKGSSIFQFDSTKQLSQKIPAVVGTLRHTCSAGFSFNVCCHSNGKQLQTELDVKFLFSFFSKFILKTGAVSLLLHRSS